MLSAAHFRPVGLQGRYARIPTAIATRFVHSFLYSLPSRSSRKISLKVVSPSCAQLVCPLTRSISTTETRFFADADDASSSTEKPKRQRGRTTTTKTEGGSKRRSTSGKTTAKKKNTGEKTKEATEAKPTFVLTKSDYPPTRPITPYLRYYLERYKSLGGGYENLFTVSSEAARLWKGMSDSEKKRYKDEFEKAMEDYRVVQVAYWEKVDPRAIRAINERRKQKGKSIIHKPRLPGLTRAPTHPFARFVQEFTARQNEALRGPEILNKASAEWRAMSSDQRSAYGDEYRRELDEYRASRSAAPSTP